MARGHVSALGHVGMGSPAERIAQGFGMLSEDRKAEASRSRCRSQTT